jgi:hypothetical protein
MSLTKSAVASVADFAPKIANCPKGVRGRDTLLKSGAEFATHATGKLKPISRYFLGKLQQNDYLL